MVIHWTVHTHIFSWQRSCLRVSSQSSSCAFSFTVWVFMWMTSKAIATTTTTFQQQSSCIAVVAKKATCQPTSASERRSLPLKWLFRISHYLALRNLYTSLHVQQTSWTLLAFFIYRIIEFSDFYCQENLRGRLLLLARYIVWCW